MRLLHVITSLDRGGSEGYLAQLAPRLQEKGFDQHVVSLTSGGFHANSLRASGIPVTELNMVRGIPDPRGVLWLVRVIRELRPDCIQSWLYHSNLLTSVALLLTGRRKSLKFVWGIRSAAMDTSLYGFGLKAVVWASAKLSRYPDAIITNSLVGERDHVRLGFTRTAMQVVPNGVDTNRYCPNPEARKAVRQELDLADDKALAGVFARNDPMKDLPGILRSLSDMHGLETIFVGTDTQKLEPFDGCRFLDARNDVPKLMAACDFTILGSVSEGFPNVVAESLSTGTPVVSTDAGDAANIIGPYGLVVPPRDSEALAGAIQAMLQKPDAERRRMGIEARKRMQSDFSFDSAVTRFAVLYEGFGTSSRTVLG